MRASPRWSSSRHKASAWSKAGQGGGFGAGFRTGGFTRPAEEIDAENAAACRVERMSGAHHLVPPARARLSGIEDAPMGGNTAERCHDRQARIADQPPGQPRHGQLAAMMQRKRSREIEDAFGHVLVHAMRIGHQIHVARLRTHSSALRRSECALGRTRAAPSRARHSLAHLTA